MKLSTVFLSGLLISSRLIASEGNHGVYYAELQAFKEAPNTKALFNEDAHPELVAIQRDITIYKALTPMQRLAQFILLSLDVIVVTPDNLPLLYACVDQICKKGDVIMPVVFVTRKKSFFNAFALKLLKSNGGIVIGQELMCNMSDEALEAIVAHEIGHIKHNHNNKLLALNASLFAAVAVMCQCLKPGFLKKVPLPRPFSDVEIGRFARELFTLELKLETIFFVSSVIAAFIINKRYEKEADEFACRTIGKSAGLIEFFEYFLKKDQLREDEFAITHNMIQQSKINLPDEYYEFVLRYYVAKGGHNMFNAYKKLYYNTFWGAHPSNQARIDAAKEYLAQQEA